MELYLKKSKNQNITEIKDIDKLNCKIVNVATSNCIKTLTRCIYCTLVAFEH